MKKNSFLFELKLLIGLVLIGQLVFFLISDGFTAKKYEGHIYATTGVQHQNEDLHKLNEAAHAFGNTIIGWTKFPHFNSDLRKMAGLTDDVFLTAHLQERQNIIFTLHSSSALSYENLLAAKDFMQSKLDEYNSVNQTRFVLSSLDYELVESSRPYGLGALAIFLASGVVWLGILFVRKEFFK